MAGYLFIIDASVSSISETRANQEMAISIHSIADLKTDDEILVFAGAPLDKVSIKLKVTADQTGSYVRVKKLYDVGDGVLLSDLPDSVKHSITGALMTGEDCLLLSETEFGSIDYAITTTLVASGRITSGDVFAGVTASPNGEPFNYIFYGAPGTGKSRTIENKRSALFPVGQYERVTFYERYSYANFVGSYKPNMKREEVAYSFVPGPFTRILMKALKNKDKNYLLIIEEVNRARAASVFGDIFQLLDRKNGESEYPITASEDLKKYLAEEYFGETYDETNLAQMEMFSEIKIPKNLYIWATMNSMDQGANALDTAFKRRWEFKYIGVNDKETVAELKRLDFRIPMCMPGAGLTVPYFVRWDDFRQEINKKILGMSNIAEDKLLGPFFVSAEEMQKVKDNPLDNAIREHFIKIFESKVLMYLFDDVAKGRPNQLFTNYKGAFILSEIFDAFEKNGEQIFGIDLKKYTYDAGTETYVEVS